MLYLLKYAFLILASSSRAMAAINAAIADYERLTCLRFKRRTSEAGYMHFYQGGGYVSINVHGK